MGLRLEAVLKAFGDPPARALDGVSMSVADGEFVAVTGRSGSGKSTLLYTLSALDPPSAGRVELDGRDAATLSSAELHRFRNLSAGFVFQFHYLLPELSALENVLMPAVKTRRAAERTPRARELLERFGLASRLTHRPGELSGGERQRVAIARALVMEPRYVFADEPTGNLDSANGEVVMRLLSDTNAGGTTVVFVTHDEDYARRARRRVHLVDGRVASDGPAA